MIRLTFIIFVSSYFSVSAQLSIPLSSLSAKTELRRFHLNKTDTFLYATVYSDTVDKYRLWIFYDKLTSNLQASNILFETFDKKDRVHKQIFLSGLGSMVKSDSEWETVDFLSDGYGDVDNKFLKFLKKQICQRFPESLSAISKLFNQYSSASIRESRYSLSGSWLSALQVCPKFENYSHSNWMTLQASSKSIDTIEISQEWQLLGTEYNTYHFNRTIIKDRLVYIEAVYNDYSTNFRRFIYNDKFLLAQIIDGRIVNDLEETENIILIVPQ